MNFAKAVLKDGGTAQSVSLSRTILTYKQKTVEMLPSVRPYRGEQMLNVCSINRVTTTAFRTVKTGNIRGNLRCLSLPVKEPRPGSGSTREWRGRLQGTHFCVLPHLCHSHSERKRAL